MFSGCVGSGEVISLKILLWGEGYGKVSCFVDTGEVVSVLFLLLNEVCVLCEVGCGSDGFLLAYSGKIVPM